MGKYAPPRDDGLKPYCVTVREWGRSRECIVYAENSGRAKYEAIGQMRYVTADARRATPEDITRLAFDEEQP